MTAEALISASYLKRQQNDFTECKVIQKGEDTAALLSIFFFSFIEPFSSCRVGESTFVPSPCPRSISLANFCLFPAIYVFFFAVFSSCACRDVNFFICVSSMCLSAIHSESRFSKKKQQKKPTSCDELLYFLWFSRFVGWFVRACVWSLWLVEFRWCFVYFQHNRLGCPPFFYQNWSSPIVSFTCNNWMVIHY